MATKYRTLLVVGFVGVTIVAIKITFGDIPHLKIAIVVFWFCNLLAINLSLIMVNYVIMLLNTHTHTHIHMFTY